MTAIITIEQFDFVGRPCGFKQLCIPDLRMVSDEGLKLSVSGDELVITMSWEEARGLLGVEVTRPSYPKPKPVAKPAEKPAPMPVGRPRKRGKK
jgi:hypothetical protein